MKALGTPERFRVGYSKMSLTADEVFRDNVLNGVPSSGVHEPLKSEIRAWGTSLESIISGGGLGGATWRATKALLLADLAHADGSLGVVYDDATAINRGLYVKTGVSGAGTWTQITTFIPGYQFVKASDDGNSTANAYTMTTAPALPAGDGVALVTFSVPATNTLSAVTVAFDGGTANPILTVAGGLPAPGAIAEDMLVVGIVTGGSFRLLSDLSSAAIQAAAETAAADAAVSASVATSAASSLLFRIFASVAAATAATIHSTSAYIAIAEFSPQPRFYKRFASDPGSGDRFQSADGAWWQGLPLPPTALNFAAPVLRSANATLGSGDLDQVHLWTIGTGTTYTATLPDPDAYLGRLLHIEVSAGSRGILAFVCPDPIGKFTATELVIWGGESLTLLASAGRWEIIGGVCKPLSLFATNPGANIATTWVANTGWVTSQQGGEEWAINAGQITVPRSGMYTSSFKVGVAWTTGPTFIYSVSSNQTTGMAIHRNQYVPTAGIANWILPSSRNQLCAKGYAITPIVIWSGGTGVVVERASFGAPELSLLEQPQW